MSNMKAHGYLDLKWSDNVLYVRSFGPFNDEGAKEAADAYVKLINNKTCTQFSVIEILQDESLGTPDTMKEVSKIWNFNAENGCTALALVYANEIQRQLAEEFLPGFGKLFQNIEDAENWVRESNA